MKRSKKNIQIARKYFFGILSLLFIYSCASTELRISEFDFSYNNEDYMIRSSYCQGNPRSCNELIGSDFIAVDLDQDRIIDKIKNGDISLAKAQEIYNYCLNILEKQGKLTSVNREIKVFTLSESDFIFELKTFMPEVNSPFNEFKITKKQTIGDHESQVVLVDHKADGKLDELLKGKIQIDDAQLKYDFVIDRGLNLKKIIKTDSLIFVR